MPPNIVWLMTDEQRTDSLGCYGSAWARTPNLDRLAGRGVLFRYAVTPAPVCVPARTSVITGRYPHETGVWRNGRFDLDLDNLMPVFRNAGYQSASFGKRHYVAPESAFDVEENLILSEAVGYYSYAPQHDPAEHDVVKYPSPHSAWLLAGRFPEPASATTEAEAVRRGVEWLDARDRDRPFFLRISFNGPHTPVVPPAPFDTLIDPARIRLPEGMDGPREGLPTWLGETLHDYARASRLTPEETARARQCYYGEVAFLDRHFGVLLDWLRDADLLDDTIIALVSDHGAHLGDYGFVQKQTFFEPVVNVPYLFAWPGRVAEGVTIDTPVETRSLLPTLMDLAGLERRDDSLGPCLRTGEAPPTRPVFSEFTLGSIHKFGFTHAGRLVMVREGPWKLTACLDPSPHDLTLHNLEEDPFERTNLADSPACRERRDELLNKAVNHV